MKYIQHKSLDQLQIHIPKYSFFAAEAETEETNTLSFPKTRSADSIPHQNTFTKNKTIKIQEKK